MQSTPTSLKHPPCFALYPWRFVLEAQEAIVFPPRLAGNTLRGALGMLLQKEDAGLFAPVREHGPSGLHDPPRPFVLRAAALDGRRFAPGAQFAFALHWFDLHRPGWDVLAGAFARLEQEGLGPTRGCARLCRVERVDTGEVVFPSPSGGQAASQPLSLPLTPHPVAVARVRIDFRTPTLWKGSEAGGPPDFGPLFSRVRDRLSTLSALYGAGSLPIDFRGLGERARNVQLIRSELRWQTVERHSRRTDQRHGLGGMVGTAEYAGDLREFVPYLQAAWWTGVGRQTVWGNGWMETRIPAAEACPEF